MQGYEPGGLPPELELTEDGSARWRDGHRTTVDGDETYAW